MHERNLKWLAVVAGALALAATLLWLVPSVLPGRPVTEAQGFATLSGRVYEGTTGLEPPNSTPLQGVRLDLYCSNDAYPHLGTIIYTSFTDADGWYGLEVERRDCDYYHIRETNPAGYVSDGATSVGGTVQSPDVIQYTVPLWEKTWTGNKFWDKAPATDTPTPTNTPTPTPTGTPPPTDTPTPTHTPTITPQPPEDIDLRLDKKVVVPPSGPVKPGDTVQFNIDVFQDSPGTATNIVITDTLPIGLSLDAAPSCTPCYGCGPAGEDQVFCQLGDWNLYPSSSVGVWLQALVDSDASGALVNTAEVSSDIPDPDLGNNIDSATAVVEESGVPLTLMKEVLVPAGGGPVKPGDKVQFQIDVIRAGSDPAKNIVISDTLPIGLSFSSASPDCTPCPGCGPAGEDQVFCYLGDYALFPGNQQWIQAVVDLDACGPLTNTARMSSDTFDPYLDDNTDTAMVDAGPCPVTPVTVIKTLTDPPGGVAAAGDEVTFDIQMTYQGEGPTTVDLEDTFLEADFDFVSATTPPTTNLSDGTWRFLLWEDFPVPGGGTPVTLQVRLRVKMPGAVATNCAHTIPTAPPGPIALTGPMSCASIQVEALEGRHASVYKRFTVPSNHVAQLGDWVSFETQWLNAGTETASEVRLNDHLTPPSVSPFLPLQFGWIWPFQTGDWARNQTSFSTHAPASPAVNTAEWAATWPDGTTTTQAASDYVYIVDGQIAKDVFLTKTFMDPLPNAAISDTVTFQVAITNASGSDLPAVALTDHFEAQCLSFQSADMAPDSVSGGVANWSDIGPLAAGASRIIDVQFHADAVCPMAFNCAQAQFRPTGGQNLFAAGCDHVPILGGRPELVVRKTRTSTSPAVVGDTVIWEIEVENVGSEPISVVPLHDAYQAAFFDFDSASPSPDTTDLVHGRLDWNDLGPLAPGAKRTVALHLTAKAPALGATNCAESRYTVGSSSFTPSACASVDILSEPPSIRVEKERLLQNPGAPTAVGDRVTFKISVGNTGPVPLSNVVVTDNYDPDCMSFVGAPGMATSFAPGFLQWDVGSLAVGETRTWEVILEVTDICVPVGLDNCAIADGEGPQGQPAHEEACVHFEAEPPAPDFAVTKRLVEPQGLPALGSVTRYEILVRNTGNTTLAVLEAYEHWDPDCLEFVGAIPAPDGVGEGFMTWDNVGPLRPGETAVLSVFLRPTDVCLPDGLRNCARAFWMVNDIPEGDAYDCVVVNARSPLHYVYLPVILRQHPEREPILSDDFDDGVLTGWTPNRGTWTNPGAHMRGEYVLGNAWNMHSSTGSNLVYTGTVNLRSGNAAGLVFRSSADGTSSYDLILDVVDGVLKISKRQPYQILASYPVAVEHNHPYTLKVVAKGSILEGYLDGVKRLTATDSTYSHGHLGVILFRSTATYDDLEARHIP